MPECDVGLQQAVDQDLLRERRADPHEDLRQLAFERRPGSFGSCEPSFDVRHEGVAVARERVGGVRRSDPDGQARSNSGGDELRADGREVARRSPRARRQGPSSSIRRVEQIGEPTGTSARARGRPDVDPPAPASPRRPTIAVENQPARRRGSATGRGRRETPPSPRGSRSPRHPQLFELTQRIGAELTCHVQQRLGPDAEIAVAQQRRSRARRSSGRRPHSATRARDAGCPRRDGRAAPGPSARHR